MKSGQQSGTTGTIPLWNVAVPTLIDRELPKLMNLCPIIEES